MKKGIQDTFLSWEVVVVCVGLEAWGPDTKLHSPSGWKISLPSKWGQSQFSEAALVEAHLSVI